MRNSNAAYCNDLIIFLQFSSFCIPMVEMKAPIDLVLKIRILVFM